MLANFINALIDAAVNFLIKRLAGSAFATAVTTLENDGLTNPTYLASANAEFSDLADAAGI